MDALLKQIKETFPDIQEADIHRIMDFLGYSTDDIMEPNPSYRLIKGESIFIQSCILDDDIERNKLDKKGQIKIDVEVRVFGNDQDCEIVK